MCKLCTEQLKFLKEIVMYSICNVPLSLVIQRLFSHSRHYLKLHTLKKILRSRIHVYKEKNGLNDSTRNLRGRDTDIWSSLAV